MKQKISRSIYLLKRTLNNHQVFVVLAVVLAVIVAVLARYYMLSSLPIDQAYVDEEVQKVKPVRFDDEAIKQMENLRDSNVGDPGTDLSTSRQNPFTE